MKFLTDQDVYGVTVWFLRTLGHDVVTASDLKMSQAKDATLLQTAQADKRIFVSRDKDFGGLVFVAGMGGGVIFLRILPSTQDAVHDEFLRVLNEHSEEELLNAFVVIEPGRHRFRIVQK
jgi:predicted nuclease of predicted toxin-antitoxin system